MNCEHRRTAPVEARDDRGFMLDVCLDCQRVGATNEMTGVFIVKPTGKVSTMRKTG